MDFGRNTSGVRLNLRGLVNCWLDAVGLLDAMVGLLDAMVGLLSITMSEDFLF